MERLFEREFLFAGESLHVAAFHILQNDVMEDRPVEVTRRAVSEPADHIWVTDSIERNSFVLKILDQSSFKICIQIVLKKDVKGLYHDLAVIGLRRSQCVTRNKDLGITSPAEVFDHVITPIDPAIT